MKFRCLNIIYITSTTCIDTSLLHSLTANSAKPISIDLRHYVCDKYWVLVRNVCQRVVRREGEQLRVGREASLRPRAI